MFGTLFRLMFWGGLALLIFPINIGKNDASMTEQIAQPGIVDTLFAARGVAEDLKQLCDRQPDACDVGSATLTTIKERAKVSAEALANYLASQPNKAINTHEMTGSIPAKTAPYGPQPVPANVPVPVARPQYP